jgi:CheY-like chemotaxis protein
MRAEPIDVLLVEDSPSDALLVREALASAGPELRPVHVDRLAAALDELERRAVEVVLLDLRLPDSTGIATLERMHAAVESEPGRGTTFRIYFPLAEGPAIPAAAVATPAAAEPAANGHGARTILLVDDEAGVRAVARLVLERQGYAVLAAASGEVALDVVRRHPGPIDLLLTDLNMPGMPVRKLIACIAEAQPDTAVVVMSGYTDQELESAALDPDTPFLQKPFTAADLVRVVGEALERAPALAV